MGSDRRAAREGAAHGNAREALADQNTAASLPRALAELDGSLLARDGTLLHRRAIRPDDAKRLRALHQRLSNTAITFRFFGALPVLTEAFAEQLSHVDYDHRMAVVATMGPDASAPIIAVVRYARVASTTAEVALAVEDRWQGQGIGPQLLWTLAAYAARRGFSTFLAEVMPENDRMLALLRHSGIPTTMRLHEGRVVAQLDISGLDIPRADDPASVRTQETMRDREAQS